MAHRPFAALQCVGKSGSLNMQTRFAIVISAAVTVALLALAPNTASADTKTAKVCNAEYAANKAAIQGSGEKKKDFVMACRAGTEVIPGGAVSTAAAPSAAPAAPATASGDVKTAKACDAEYSANKDAIKGAGQKKKDFVAACRAGTEVIPAAAASVAPAAPSAPATTSSAPQPAAPAPTRTKTFSPGPAATTAPTGANEFATDTQAKARCPGSNVVWVNLKSQVWHWAGTHDYGNTEKGAYMCQADATAEGARAAKNEKAPA
jgi:hypothetical protein